MQSNGVARAHAPVLYAVLYVVFVQVGLLSVLVSVGTQSKELYSNDDSSPLS